MCLCQEDSGRLEEEVSEPNLTNGPRIRHGLHLLRVHSSLDTEFFIIPPSTSMKPTCPKNLHYADTLRNLIGFNIFLLKGWSRGQQHLHEELGRDTKLRHPPRCPESAPQGDPRVVCMHDAL